MTKKSQLFLSTILLTVAMGGCAKKDAATTAEADKGEKAAVATETKGEAKGVDAKAAETKGPVTMDGITVHKAVACRAVQDREPVETSSSFPADVGRIYLFSKVGVDGGAKSSIKHVWFFNGKEVATVTLPVEGSGWRTYSSKAIQDAQKGKWKVDITSGDGVVVQSVAFNIE